MLSLFNFNKNLFNKNYLYFLLNVVLTCSVIFNSYFCWIGKYLFHLNLSFFYNYCYFVIFFTFIFTLVPNSLIYFLKVSGNSKIVNFVNTVRKVLPLQNPIVLASFVYILTRVEPLYFSSVLSSLTIYILIFSFIRAFILFPCMAFYSLFTGKSYTNYINYLQKVSFHGSPRIEFPNGGNLGGVNVETIGLAVALTSGIAGSIGEGISLANQHAEKVENTLNQAIAVDSAVIQSTNRLLVEKQVNLTEILKNEKVSEKLEEIALAKHAILDVTSTYDQAVNHRQLLLDLQNDLRNMSTLDILKEKLAKKDDSLLPLACQELKKSYAIQEHSLLLERPSAVVIASSLENIGSFF